MVKKTDVPDQEYLDYNSETDTYKIKVTLSEAEEELNKNYEIYLKTKSNVDEALDIDSFYNVIVNIGFYTDLLKRKEDYLKLLEVEIGNIKRKIEHLELKL